MKLTLAQFAEQLQDHIAANSTLGLTVGENFTLGNLLDIQDMEGYLASKIELTMFEEPGTLSRTGRRFHQERTIRFLYKGDYGQQAINRCHALLEWLQNSALYSNLSSFKAIVARVDKLPSVVAADQSGTHLADCIVTFFVYNPTG